MKYRFHSGQSLVEVVVATGIAMLVLVALVAGATIAVRNSQFSRTKARAMQLNREATEWLRGERKNSWSEFLSKADDDGKTFCFDSLSWNDGSCSASEIIDSVFTREAILTKIDENKIDIKITTSWTDSNGEHNEQVITYLTKW